MPLQLADNKRKTQKFVLHDDSRRAQLALGPRFSRNEGSTNEIRLERQKPSIAVSPELPLLSEWSAETALFNLCVKSRVQKASSWSIAVEENVHEPDCYRAVAQATETGETHHLQIERGLVIVTEAHNLMEVVPDCIFGALLGVSSGMAEAELLLASARQREEPVLSEISRHEWRAPRLSFTLRTAAGSPFVERWAVAIQESSSAFKQFRIWIEQQRTGKEIGLFLRADGSVEGMHELEALPAAIHGVGLGMLYGMDFMVRRFEGAHCESTTMGKASVLPVRPLRRQPVN